MMLSNYTNSRDNNFNLIRFIAAILVLYSHSYLLATGTLDGEPIIGLTGMIWGGIAVDVFFVTSGFLIAGSFLNRNNLIAFMFARVLRIYPALVVAIVFCVFIVGLYFTKYTAIEYFSDLNTYKYFIKNVVLMFGVEHHLPGVFLENPYAGVNGSLWTLPHEVRLYATLAIIGSAFVYYKRCSGKKSLRVSILFVAVLAIILNIVNHYHYFISARLCRQLQCFLPGRHFMCIKKKFHCL